MRGDIFHALRSNMELQQYLPFTVLKLTAHLTKRLKSLNVATVLTVYGIETLIIILTDNNLPL